MNDSNYQQEVRGLTLVWAWTVPLLFLVLVLLGLTMRLGQATIISVDADLFYAIMTLHGLGMGATAFVGGLAGVTYLLARYVRVNLAILWTTYVLTVLGVAGLLIACLIGRFGPGWYLLYPLPFFSKGVWPDWALGLGVVSLIVLGVALMLGQVEVARALIARYGFMNSMGWQYFRKASAGRVEIPPIVLISAAACLVPGIITTIDGAVLLLLYLFQWFSPAITFDPLAFKNMVFLWGHTLVNITMYLGLAMVYELLPKYSGKPWKTNTVVAISWNLVLVYVLTAFFHHLYMDFAQPNILQYIGQIASYLSVVPATVVTVFGVIGQVYRSGMQWRFVPLCFFLGTVGWVIGGFAAVVDSTITVNSAFHNTLWVPAHFHTYFLVGYFLMLWGFLYDFSGSGREKVAKAGLSLVVVGGYGFLLMFYLGGTFGVPRRYAVYDSIPLASLAASGERLASIAAAFIVIFIIGLLFVLGIIYGGLANRRLTGELASPGR
ncbi:MAG TPA: cbb3-type cytochrome c oxidase subunit I [Xanthobacteraceae bacterium]|jgi:cytochrome c oxidase subunit 1